MSHIFPSFLSTPRLFLRRLQRDNGDALCNYRSLPEVARYQGWESFGPEDARRLIESQDHAEPGIPGTWFQVAVVERATNVLIGDCGLHCLQDEPYQMEFGAPWLPVIRARVTPWRRWSACWSMGLTLWACIG
ncbi:Acetyltransferase (GNAT) domain-containing protein [Prosthecobacter debontii]|uniref:Acetyltransferase (GNAT) domain-containing protein n=1 Tax=Prosthecobacter debontii TaxID=48467 RepID=A0A1T4WU15_9BACT|nr:Acetyltransferase (GNAT) domain-containing protein [Prosthecobacter debontii]